MLNIFSYTNQTYSALPYRTHPALPYLTGCTLPCPTLKDAPCPTLPYRTHHALPYPKGRTLPCSALPYRTHLALPYPALLYPTLLDPPVDLQQVVVGAEGPSHPAVGELLLTEGSSNAAAALHTARRSCPGHVSYLGYVATVISSYGNK